MLEKLLDSHQFDAITEKNIYVTCPAGIVTGGPELLHQLVGLLVKKGKNAFIAYSPLGRQWETPEAYKRYQCPVVQHVPDDKDSVVIVPEVSTASLFRFRHARRAIWWLSVDNYRGGVEDLGALVLYVRRRIRADIPSAGNLTHLFQSAYAKDFVYRRFAASGAMLSDYLASEYLSEHVGGARKRVVAYNPKKGFSYTRKIIEACSGIKFLPLINMSRAQVRSALETCSIYMDFGTHPGKDRIPREAAMCGAVVLVGRNGAAKYVEDVPLSDHYKFERRASSIPEIKQRFEDIFENFDKHYADQLTYRKMILREPEIFESQVNRIFNIC